VAENKRYLTNLKGGSIGLVPISLCIRAKPAFTTQINDAERNITRISIYDQTKSYPPTTPRTDQEDPTVTSSGVHCGLQQGIRGGV